jgi:hypothetical protein
MAHIKRATESKVLHERADNCRRLAFGVGNPQFTKALTLIADEYDARAAFAESLQREDQSKNRAGDGSVSDDNHHWFW